METLTTLSPAAQCDVTNIEGKRRNSSCTWGQSKNKDGCVFNRSPPAGVLQSEQLSHLQRNKELENMLLQQEEELNRLQEENNKLRQFLNSSFIGESKDKAKKLSANGTKNLNRKPPYHVCSFQNCTRRHPHISKRVCRNLSAEFSSAESGSADSSSTSSEPTLDLWVLRTLGLKDPDTIDTSSLPAAYQKNLAVSPVAHQIESDQSDCSYGSVEGLQSHHAIMASTPNHISPPSGHQFSEETHLSQAPFCSPVLNWSWTAQSQSQVGQSVAGHPDLAFSMSLSPASSVKTLSYPQGQAFIRRDPQGRCNFTWLPTHISRKQDPGVGL
ncbi:geminin coiled-coil domain-containing protein 1 isoform X2 [Hippocampus comes]|nr:PREDICTED: geminin coiled-coil domain-containing protein 1 isoform X2 [Hippocampus comes]